MNQTTLTVRIKHRLARWIALSIALVEITLATAVNAGIVPTNQLVAGKSYGEWSAHFWKWVLELPYNAQHPFQDRTGSIILKSQSGPVLYLFGSSNPNVRTIAVPDDRFLYVEILSLSCTTLDDPPFKPATTNEADMRICADSFVESDLFMEIDGVAVTSLPQYHFTSSLFSFVLTTPNMFGLPAGTVGQGVGAANGVILEPLSPGSHQIRFYGRYPSENYTSDLVYNITVYARPALSARLLPDSGAIQLSWPAGTGFALQQANNPAVDATWATASIVSSEVIGDTQVATVANPSTGSRFFRLYRPLWSAN